jgi:hypothetical protein
MGMSLCPSMLFTCDYIIYLECTFTTAPKNVTLERAGICSVVEGSLKMVKMQFKPPVMFFFI